MAQSAHSLCSQQQEGVGMGMAGGFTRRILQLAPHRPELSYGTRKCSLRPGQSCVHLDVGISCDETKERIGTGGKRGGGQWDMG